MAAKTQLEARIDALDDTLFSLLASQTTVRDRRALLSLHGTIAARLGAFSYLEIGSYLGGSLQVLIRDPRCAHAVSIDSRPHNPPDKRVGTWTYEFNTTSAMLQLLGSIPGADMNKLTTFEVGTDELRAKTLPTCPDYCFIDGEHTDEAALRDARFCASALGDTGGVIAFHDYLVVQPAIRTFVREVWGEASLAFAFADGVFALEIGDRGLLRSAAIDRAVESQWHSLVWKLLSRSHQSPLPLLAAWSAMRPIDTAIFQIRARFKR